MLLYPFNKKEEKEHQQNIKIWSVSTRLSGYLFAIRHLCKLKTASISIYKQNKSNIKNNLEFSRKRTVNAMHMHTISSDDHI